MDLWDEGRMQCLARMTQWDDLEAIAKQGLKEGEDASLDTIWDDPLYIVSWETGWLNAGKGWHDGWQNIGKGWHDGWQNIGKGWYDGWQNIGKGWHDPVGAQNLLLNGKRRGWNVLMVLWERTYPTLCVEWSEQGLVLSQRALSTLYIGRLGAEHLEGIVR